MKRKALKNMTLDELNDKVRREALVVWSLCLALLRGPLGSDYQPSKRIRDAYLLFSDSYSDDRFLKDMRERYLFGLNDVSGYLNANVEIVDRKELLSNHRLLKLNQWRAGFLGECCGVGEEMSCIINQRCRRCQQPMEAIVIKAMYQVLTDHHNGVFMPAALPAPMPLHCECFTEPERELFVKHVAPRVLAGIGEERRRYLEELAELDEFWKQPAYKELSQVEQWGLVAILRGRLQDVTISSRYHEQMVSELDCEGEEWKDGPQYDEED